MLTQTPEKQIVDTLSARGQSLATAESCTGGLIGHRISNVSGASAVYLGGVVAYSNAVKVSILGVLESALNTHGAVSETVARGMAEGVRRVIGSDWGVGITGIAGPGGGSPEKPVGLVYIGVSGANGTRVERNLFSGDRESVKSQAADKALEMLLEEMG